MLKSSLNIQDKLEFEPSVALDSFSFSNGRLIMPNKTSGKIIGEVTVDEYDAYGRKIFSDTSYNDITLPGSIFILEQMFKIKSGSARFLHPTSDMPTTYGSESGSSIAGGGAEISDVNDQKVFGFMVGIGGESGGNVVAPNYNINRLVNSENKSSFLPFVTSNDKNVDKSKYAFKATDKNGIEYYYVKKLDTTDSSIATIHAKWADGSGDFTDSDININIATPVVAYAQCSLTVGPNDVRGYFGDMNLDQCAINQLGLVAGKPPVDETGDYTDIKLVTCVNFKTRDLSNTENTLKITYKIYCL